MYRHLGRRLIQSPEKHDLAELDNDKSVKSKYWRLKALFSLIGGQ